MEEWEVSETLNVETEVHDVAILNLIILTLNSEFASLTASGLTLESHVVVIFDDLGADEALLKVGMDDACGLGSLVASVESPSADLLRTDSEESAQIENAIGSANKLSHATLFQTEIVKEHLALLISLQLGNLALSLSGDDKDLCALLLHSLTDSIDIGVALIDGSLIYIANINDRLTGEEEELLIQLSLSLGQLDSAKILSIHQGVLVAQEEIEQLLGIGILTAYRLLLALINALLHRLKILDLELSINNALVADGVYRTIDMSDVLVIETTEDVNDSISLTNIGKELIAEALTFTCALDETGYVHNLDSGRDNLLRVLNLIENFEPVVWHGNDAHVGLYGAKREIGRLGLGIREAVEEC